MADVFVIHHRHRKREVLKAACLVRDAVYERDANHGLDETSIWTHEILHSTWFMLLRFCLIATDLILTYYEDSSWNTAQERILKNVDLVCAIFFAFHASLKTFASLHFWDLPKTEMIWSSLRILISFTNLVFSSLALMSKGQPRLLAIFRPFFLLDFSEGIRAMFFQFLHAILSSYYLYIFLLIFVFICSAFAKIFFEYSTTENSYAHDNFELFLQLFVALTTCNFPDIGRLPYLSKRVSFVFWVVFYIFGLYFGLNFVLASIYTQYRSECKTRVIAKHVRERSCLVKAFETLSRLQRQINAHNAKRFAVFSTSPIANSNSPLDPAAPTSSAALGDAVIRSDGGPTPLQNGNFSENGQQQQQQQRDHVLVDFNGSPKIGGDETLAPSDAKITPIHSNICTPRDTNNDSSLAEYDNGGVSSASIMGSEFAEDPDATDRNLSVCSNESNASGSDTDSNEEDGKTGVSFELWKELYDALRPHAHAMEAEFTFRLIDTDDTGVVDLVEFLEIQGVMHMHFRPQPSTPSAATSMPPPQTPRASPVLDPTSPDLCQDSVAPNLEEQNISQSPLPPHSSFTRIGNAPLNLSFDLLDENFSTPNPKLLQPSSFNSQVVSSLRRPRALSLTNLTLTPSSMLSRSFTPVESSVGLRGFPSNPVFPSSSPLSESGPNSDFDDPRSCASTGGGSIAPTPTAKRGTRFRGGSLASFLPRSISRDTGLGDDLMSAQTPTVGSRGQMPRSARAHRLRARAKTLATFLRRRPSTVRTPMASREVEPIVAAPPTVSLVRERYEMLQSEPGGSNWRKLYGLQLLAGFKQSSIASGVYQFVLLVALSINLLTIVSFCDSLFMGQFESEFSIVLWNLDAVFALVWAAEQAFVMTFAGGWAPFWDDYRNRFDCVLVVLSGVARLTIQYFYNTSILPFHDGDRLPIRRDISAYVRVLVLFRAFILFRFGSAWNWLWRLLETFITVIRSVLLAVASVIFSLYFVFACIAMALFQGALVPDNPNLVGTDYANAGYFHYITFNTFGETMTTLFHLQIVNNWMVTMFGTMKATQNRNACIFFLVYYFVMVVVVINLVVALVVEVFRLTEERTKQGSQKSEAKDGWLMGKEEVDLVDALFEEDLEILREAYKREQREKILAANAAQPSTATANPVSGTSGLQ